MTSTLVRTYKNSKDFSKDAARMARRGYQVASTFQEPSKNKPLRNLLKAPVGGTLLWGSSIKGGKIVVTYQAGSRGPVAPAAPAPLQGSTLSPWAMLPVQPAPRGIVARHRGLMVWSLVVLALLMLAVVVMAGASF